MFLKIRFNSRTPLTTQIADAMAKHMDENQLPHGHHLPPVRLLARELHVTTKTVARSYAKLRLRGLIKIPSRTSGAIVNRPGSPEECQERSDRNLARLEFFVNRLARYQAEYHAFVRENYL